MWPSQNFLLYNRNIIKMKVTEWKNNFCKNRKQIDLFSVFYHRLKFWTLNFNASKLLQKTLHPMVSYLIMFIFMSTITPQSLSVWQRNTLYMDPEGSETRFAKTHSDRHLLAAPSLLVKNVGVKGCHWMWVCVRISFTRGGKFILNSWCKAVVNFSTWWINLLLIY